MELRLKSMGTLDIAHMLSVLSIHSLSAQEEIDTRTAEVHRILRIEDTLVDVYLRLDDSGISVIHDAPASAVPRLQATIDHWFGLTQDTATAYASLSNLAGFKELSAAYPNLRLISYPDPFEALATTVIGQQVSLAAARTLAGRYVVHLGEEHPSGLRAFPTARATSSLSPGDIQSIIRCPLARATTLHTVSTWYQDCGQDLVHQPTEFLSQLLSLRGVGPWTRDYMALRALRDPQIFLDSDLVVRRALKNLAMPDFSSSSLLADSKYLATLLLWAYDAEKR